MLDPKDQNPNPSMLYVEYQILPTTLAYNDSFLLTLYRSATSMPKQTAKFQERRFPTLVSVLAINKG